MTDSPSETRVLVVSLINANGIATLTEAALESTTEAVANCGPDIRAILISHPGRNFCLGGDVQRFAEADDPHAYVGSVARTFHATIRALVHTPVPVVAAVQGWAAGAGMSIAAAADIAVAGESTKFRAAYPGLGFTPDGGLSWTLPRAVGRARALDLLLTDRVVGAQEAQSIGLVSRVVPDDRVLADAEAIARALSLGSFGAAAGVKKLVDDGFSRGLDEHLDAEAASIAERAAAPDGREGLRAFVERRAANFAG